LGAIALANLLAKEGRSAPAEAPAANPLAPKSPQFQPTAKNVIFLFMSGGPSQLDLFDPKAGVTKVAWKAAARFSDEGSEAGFCKAERRRDGQPPPVPSRRPVRNGFFRLPSAHRLLRRRYLPTAFG